MFRSSRYALRGTLYAGLAITACAGCSRQAVNGSASADTVYVGVAAARTNAAYFNGVQLALDRLNADRQPGTPPLALRLPPDSQPSQVEVAARFRDDERVIGVVGHTGSAQTMDAAPIYGDVANSGAHGIVAITPTSTNPQVTRVSEWVFRVCPTDADAARALARFAIDSLNARRVAIVYRNDLFGRGYTQTIAPTLVEGGIGIVERDPYLAGITEYQAYATRIARAGTDAIVFAGGGVDAADLVRALHNVGARPAVLGSDDVANILQGAKPVHATVPLRERRRGGSTRDTAVVVGDDRELFRGVRFTAFYDANRAVTDEEKYFAAEYRRRYGERPSHQAALSYDAAMLIGRAFFAVGRDRRQIRDWIANVGRGAPAQQGITGPIRFDEYGDALEKPVLIGSIVP